jgi:putative endonuclease
VKNYYVYILASKSRTLYTGITNNLERRVIEHRRKLIPGFTARYNINRLVYFEVFHGALDAIGREKQIKSWSRMKKVALIESANRDWQDLSDGWPGSASNVIPTAMKRLAEQSFADPRRSFRRR